MSTTSAQRALLRSLCAARDALATGKCTAKDLMRTAIEVTREANVRVNAFVSIDEVAALNEATQADSRRENGTPLSPWDGIPIGVKDNIDVIGFPTSNGIVKAAPASVDADCMGPWRAAGCIVLGKLNMHEAALGTTTENPHFGSTRNPVDPGFSAGGSSGGSAAAVAAGMVPLALGSDTMGSIRLPAANCGLFGWKPEQKAQSLRGVCVLHPDLDAVGPLVGALEDVAAVMDILQVPVEAPSPPAPVAFSALSDFAVPTLHDEVRALWQSFLASMQCETVTLAGFEPTPVRRALLLDIETRLQVSLTPSMHERASMVLKGMVEFGARVSAEQSQRAAAVVAAARAEWLELLANVDVLLTPATPIPPTALGAPPVAHHADLLLAANLTGCPAVVMPLGSTAGGLPIGLHLMCAPGRERRLLAAMAQAQRVITGMP
jgi:aspartyl-tRNA(Asn)/glutamyl-tRNA(Gln) amidotransferase subunit A